MSRWTTVALAMLLAASGCGGEDAGGGDSGACTTNATQGCQCLVDGSIADGLQTCTAEAIWSTCQCGPCDATCDGMVCGDDGCGGSCGACAPGLSCASGQCQAGCTADCTDRVCGDDGCGGSCGECGGGDTCSILGQCVAPGACDGASDVAALEGDAVATLEACADECETCDAVDPVVIDPDHPERDGQVTPECDGGFGLNSACYDGCFTDALTLSEGCADCFTPFMACVYDECLEDGSIVTNPNGTVTNSSSCVPQCDPFLAQECAEGATIPMASLDLADAVCHACWSEACLPELVACAGAGDPFGGSIPCQFGDSGVRIDRSSTSILPPAGVRVVFRVLDCDGLPVRELTASDVTIINDAKNEPFGTGGEGGSASAPSAPSEFGLYSILVLDMSDSIVNTPGAVGDVVAGAEAFVVAMVENMPETYRHEVALMVFGSPTKTEVIVDFTDDAAVLHSALQDLEANPESLGTTDLYGAYIKGIDAVKGEGYGLELVERSMVILTDGTHEAGDEENLRGQALAKKLSSGVTAFSIGIQGTYDESKLEELATHPSYFQLVEDASALGGVFEGFAARLEEIARSNYAVGVCTPVALGTGSMTIQVNVDGETTSERVTYATSQLTGVLSGCDPDVIANPCGERECGAAPVGSGSCGTCSDGSACSSDGMCEAACVPMCDGVTCGDDGCGGLCEDCPDAEYEIQIMGSGPEHPSVEMEAGMTVQWVNVDEEHHRIWIYLEEEVHVAESPSIGP
ncbi:MAG: VWA domain-containing protein, partial [Myxococcota bacterium]|nr:VWA domain-containing protein [Myxococcota bacterium]